MASQAILFVLEKRVDSITNQWTQLLNSGRRKKDAAGYTLPGNSETRTEIERDYDRILFCTPLRRLADKTQVFPLDRNASVRTRLTHSHEVSNLARSIGTTLVFNHHIGSDCPNALRNIPALLATIGLVHDLGNPPFGHQGEGAIQSWFRDHQTTLLEDPQRPMDAQQKQDCINWEGNAQAFRLVTRLQVLNDTFGLDLTYATLSAMMKYPTSSTDTAAITGKTTAANKKHGFFSSEQTIAELVQQKTGLAMGLRHPLAYVMEACDDIAYVVLDVEDAVKKGLASFSDLVAFLEHHAKDDDVANTRLIDGLIAKSRAKHIENRNITPPISPTELNDVSMQLFRISAIGEMVRAATDAFIDSANYPTFMAGIQTRSLLSLSRARSLRKNLKDFALKHAYNHRMVLELELNGYNVIRELMDIFWAAISDIADPAQPGTQRRHPFTRYIYGSISENYRRVYESSKGSRYDECVLLTDMISGMTDSYAMNLHEELMPLKQKFDWERGSRR
jgi:dGTPase